MTELAGITPENLTGKVAIATGGGRDIGRACALTLAAGGAAVAINYHSSSDGADSAVDEIICVDGKAFSMQGDMTSGDEVAALIDKTIESFGDQIDILIHVTGGLVARKSLAEMDVDHWDHVMALNATSFMRTAKEPGPNTRVNSICPGMIDTDFHNTFTKAEVRAHVANITPLKREGLPQDVANLATFLASDQSAFITGANIDINGGMLFS